MNYGYVGMPGVRTHRAVGNFGDGSPFRDNGLCGKKLIMYA